MSGLVHRDLNKWKKITSKYPKPADVQLKEKSNEIINERIQNEIPASHPVEFNSIISVISDKLGYNKEIVHNAIINADPKKIIIVDTDSYIFVKRNIF